MTRYYDDDIMSFGDDEIYILDPDPDIWEPPVTGDDEVKKNIYIINDCTLIPLINYSHILK